MILLETTTFFKTKIASKAVFKFSRAQIKIHSSLEETFPLELITKAFCQTKIKENLDSQTSRLKIRTMLGSLPLSKVSQNHQATKDHSGLSHRANKTSSTLRDKTTCLSSASMEEVIRFLSSPRIRYLNLRSLRTVNS